MPFTGTFAAAEFDPADLGAQIINDRPHGRRVLSEKIGFQVEARLDHAHERMLR
jgi:hypothetical protein